MGRSADLPQKVLDIIMHKHSIGIKPAQIARDLLMDRSTVWRVIQRKGIKAKRPGCPSKLSPQDERSILRETTKNPRVFATEIAEALAPVKKVSARTVRRVLKRSGIRDRIARRKALLTKAHKSKPVTFAKKYLNKKQRGD